MANAKSHKCITRATRTLLKASPTISNSTLSDVIHSEFSEFKTEEVIRSIHLGIWWFNHNYTNLTRDYKNL